MSASLTLWVVIAVVGVLNYLSRLSFIAIFARRSMPPMLARALKYVPAAMLTALVLPMVVVGAPDAVAGVWAAWPRIVAALLAGIVGFRTRNTLATMGAGMLALWALQWLAG